MISPIENNGMVMRMQDFSIIRQNEDSQALTQHVQIQGQLEKTEEQTAHSVSSKDDADGAGTEHDAREESRNKYTDMRKKKKAVLPDDSEGVVVKKNAGGFDISV